MKMKIKEKSGCSCTSYESYSYIIFVIVKTVNILKRTYHFYKVFARREK